MQPGSHGPAVNPMLRWINSWAIGQDLGPTGIVEDDDFGGVGKGWVMQYQASKGLTADGGCGPDTRKAMFGDGFDLEQAMKDLGDVELTCFVQPNGAGPLYWAPGICPLSNRDEAERALRRAQGSV
jgi:hypothetical protein